MSTKGMFKLQGLDPSRWSRLASVSGADFKACLGNAMAGNVVKAVLLAVLKALGEIEGSAE